MAKYHFNKVTKQKLIKLGFREGEENFTLRFPIKSVSMFGMITTDLSGSVTIDVLTSNGEKYPAFYGLKYGNYTTILEMINKEIRRECNKLGIVERKNKYGKNKRTKTNVNEGMS